MAISTSVYGTDASNAVTYSVANVSVGGAVTTAKFTSLITTINSERTRRGKATTTITLATNISATNVNAMKTALNISGPAATSAYENKYGGTGANQNLSSGGGTALTAATYPQVAAPTLPSDVSRTSTVRAADLNAIIYALNTAGAACTCNCNYCTCNCNYCTCNCNYACTCNCNYSDIRLKENIELVDIVGDLNVYSYSYIWDKAKRFIGVMAQDLIGTKYETALYTDTQGFYTVDYSQLPVKFKEI